MYIIPMFQAGDRKGQSIMNEIEEGNRWSDMWNDIFVNREHDKDWNHLDTFQVAERQRGNTHTIWATGLTFDGAMDLACRLTVGKDYLPPKREDMKLTPYFEYEVGDVVPGDFHMHQFNPCGLKFDYVYDDDSRMEIDRDLWFSAHKATPPVNKSGVIVSMSEEDIPAKIMVVYSYDDRYFSAILRKK